MRPTSHATAATAATASFTATATAAAASFTASFTASAGFHGVRLERLETDVGAGRRGAGHGVRLELALQLHRLGRLLRRQLLVAQLQRVTDQIQPLARLAQTRLRLDKCQQTDSNQSINP